MRLYCHYCKRDDPTHSVWAPFSIHDARGCFHVCLKHAKWRGEASMIAGHSKDCPYSTEPR